MTPFNLPARAAFTAALEAARANKFVWQQPGPLSTCCLSFGGDHPCAIGVALPEELRKTAATDYAYVGTLVSDGLIETDNVHALRDLQDRHDELVLRFRGDEDDAASRDIPALTKEFVEYCETKLATL